MQYKDKSWGDVKSLPEAVTEFFDGIQDDTVRKMVVGTEEEVEKMIDEDDAEARLNTLCDRIMDLESKMKASDSPITLPTASEVEKFSNVQGRL